MAEKLALAYGKCAWYTEACLDQRRSQLVLPIRAGFRRTGRPYQAAVLFLINVDVEEFQNTSYLSANDITGTWRRTDRDATPEKSTIKPDDPVASTKRKRRFYLSYC